MKNIIADIIIWAGAILPLAFLVQYTLTVKGRWWTNVAGRSIVALDACLVLLFGAFAIQLATNQEVHLTKLSIILLGLAPCVILYRMIGLERKRRSRKKIKEGQS